MKLVEHLAVDDKSENKITGKPVVYNYNNANLR